MKSMTGFGHGEASSEGRLMTVDIKTVNHRYFEPSIRLPRKLLAFENDLRNLLKERIGRGKTDVFVNYANHSEEQGAVWLNSARLGEYVKALRAEGEKFGLRDDLSVSCILRIPDVLETEESEEDEELLKSLLLDAASSAADALDQMREKEGNALCADILTKISALEASREKILARAPFVVSDYKAKLEARLAELLGPEATKALDAGRLAAEVTIFSDKCCIDEELTRLGSHFTQFKQIIGGKEACGKKLDFLTQELNRETNTIASKSNDLEITREALAMKNEIEKVREQIQNLE